MTEIDQIVFADTAKQAKLAQNIAAKKAQAAASSAANNNYNTIDSKKGAVDRSVNQSKSSIKPYEEEESYENPVNISKAPGCQDDYVDIRSEYANAGAAVNMSIGGVNVS